MQPPYVPFLNYPSNSQSRAWHAHHGSILGLAPGIAPRMDLRAAAVGTTLDPHHLVADVLTTVLGLLAAGHSELHSIARMVCGEHAVGTPFALHVQHLMRACSPQYSLLAASFAVSTSVEPGNHQAVSSAYCRTPPSCSLSFRTTPAWCNRRGHNSCPSHTPSRSGHGHNSARPSCFQSCRVTPCSPLVVR